MSTMLKEKGQTLIMFALGLVGLLALVGLAIDGGNAFADRRNAQNAADNAAYAAALKKVGACANNTMCDTSIWQPAGFAVAAANGYVDGQDGDTVEILWPPSPGYLAQNLDAASNPHHYIQVEIHSTFDTYFARVIGIDIMQNRVSAVVKLKDTKMDGMYDGASVVSLAPQDCRSFEIDGAAKVHVIGSGMLVNSSCPANCPNGALQITNSPKAIVETPGIILTDGSTACGTDVLDPAKTTLVTDADQWHYPIVEYILPEPICASEGVWDPTNKTLSPGHYTQFPPQGTGKVVTLLSGTYCIDEGLTINSTDEWRTEDNTSGTGEGVLFYFKPCTGNICDVTINGNSNTSLVAATNLAYSAYPGLLMYFAEDPNCDPVANGDGCRTVTINGTGGLDMEGTILGQDSSIRVSGTAGGGESFTLASQIIGYDVYFSGTSDVTILYDGGDQVKVPISPSIELVK